MGERRFSEAEANEILRTAVRLAGPQSLGFEELSRAAAEMGISREQLEEAERSFIQRQKETDRRAFFRQLQRNQVLIEAAVGSMIVAFVAMRDWQSGTLQSDPVLFFVVPMGTLWFLARTYAAINRSSKSNRKAYENLEKVSLEHLTVNEAEKILESVVNDAVEAGLGREAVEKDLRKRLLYDRHRVRETLADYLSEHPEVEAKLAR